MFAQKKELISCYTLLHFTVYKMSCCHHVPCDALNQMLIVPIC